MIIFNDTVIVEEAIHEKWLKWTRENYIPAVMETGFFNSYKILNVIDSPNEGITYWLQDMHNREFENQFIIFNTLMKTVD